MQTIGERLEEARKRKGLSIREAAEATKIRGDYLQKFEANSFDIDLPPLYIRGFVRNYARYLELDGERIAQEFYSAMMGESRPARRETREVYGRVDFGESGGDESVAPVGRTGPDQAMMLKFAVLGGGALIVVVLLLVVINLFTTKPEPPVRNTPVAAAAEPKHSVLTLTILDETRVSVSYADKSKVFLDGRYASPKGDVQNIRFTRDLLVTVEYPERVRLEVNGRYAEIPVKTPMAHFRVPYEAPR